MPPSAECATPGTSRSVFIDEAAQILGVSRRTVYYRIREGRLWTIRTRCGSQRVLVDSIESLLREMRESARRSIDGENGARG
jgi:excisionase family DNA binding protein